MTHSGTISLFLNDFKIQRLERINMQLLVFQPFSDFTVIQRRYDHELGESKISGTKPIKKIVFSQILVMPPFQRMGLGSTLLENIYAHYNTANVLEITMEDPSPECQRVRDFIDAKNCTSLPEFGRDFVNKGWDD